MKYYSVPPGIGIAKRLRAKILMSGKNSSAGRGYAKSLASQAAVDAGLSHKQLANLMGVSARRQYDRFDRIAIYIHPKSSLRTGPKHIYNCNQ